MLSDCGYRLLAKTEALRAGQVEHTVVVQHCGTETIWRASYVVRSEVVEAIILAALEYEVSLATAPTTWQEVVPVVETRTVYRPVSTQSVT